MSEEVPPVPGEHGDPDEDRLPDRLRQGLRDLTDEIKPYTPEDHKRLNQDVFDRVAAIENRQPRASRPRASQRHTRLPVCRRPSYEQLEPETDW